MGSDAAGGGNSRQRARGTIDGGTRTYTMDKNPKRPRGERRAKSREHGEGTGKRSAEARRSKDGTWNEHTEGGPTRRATSTNTQTLNINSTRTHTPNGGEGTRGENHAADRGHGEGSGKGRLKGRRGKGGTLCVKVERGPTRYVTRTRTYTVNGGKGKKHIGKAERRYPEENTRRGEKEQEKLNATAQNTKRMTRRPRNRHRTGTYTETVKYHDTRILEKPETQTRRFARESNTPTHDRSPGNAHNGRQRRGRHGGTEEGMADGGNGGGRGMAGKLPEGKMDAKGSSSMGGYTTKGRGGGGGTRGNGNGYARREGKKATARTDTSEAREGGGGGGGGGAAAQDTGGAGTGAKPDGVQKVHRKGGGGSKGNGTRGKAEARGRRREGGNGREAGASAHAGGGEGRGARGARRAGGRWPQAGGGHWKREDGREGGGGSGDSASS